MDISLIPVFFYKLPKLCKNVMITNHLIYTIQEIKNDVKNTEKMNTDTFNNNKNSVEYNNNYSDCKRYEIGVVSCHYATAQIGDDSVSILHHYRFINFMLY